MQDRTRRIRLAKKRHKHELTKKRRRKHKMNEFYATRHVDEPATIDMALLHLAFKNRKRR